MIICLDPGPVQSAWVTYEERRTVLPWNQAIYEFGKSQNEYVLSMIDSATGCNSDRLVIEKIACMGMAVGAEVFETVFWSGRFAQAFGADRCDRITRHAVKINLCGSARAKDANIRQAIIDRFGGPATIKKGGPLYRVSGDCWSALAVALTWCDLRATQPQASLFEEPELAVRG